MLRDGPLGFAQGTSTAGQGSPGRSHRGDLAKERGHPRAAGLSGHLSRVVMGKQEISRKCGALEIMMEPEALHSLNAPGHSGKAHRHVTVPQPAVQGRDPFFLGWSTPILAQEITVPSDVECFWLLWLLCFKNSVT